MKGNLSCVSCCVLYVVLLVTIVISIYYLHCKTIRQSRQGIHGGFLVVLKKLHSNNYTFPKCLNISVSTVLLSCFGAISCSMRGYDKTLYKTETRQTD